MTPDAIAHALLAVEVADDGDAPAAQALIVSARRCAQRTARRERQIVEIAALVVGGHRPRAAGLAMEHASLFAEDVDLLARVIGAVRP